MAPNQFFDPWQATIGKSRKVTPWQSAQNTINEIIGLATADRELAWRGVHDASFALHSSLYRRLKNLRGAPPDEDDLIDYEVRLLSKARREWRFDNLIALELLAHMQHFGGPTRLLSKNSMTTMGGLSPMWMAGSLRSMSLVGRLNSMTHGERVSCPGKLGRLVRGGPDFRFYGDLPV